MLPARICCFQAIPAEEKHLQTFHCPMGEGGVRAVEGREFMKDGIWSAVPLPVLLDSV